MIPAAQAIGTAAGEGTAQALRNGGHQGQQRQGQVGQLKLSPLIQGAVEPEPKPAAESPTPVRQPHGLIDDQAKRLADFFNGEVVDVQDPLPELGDDQAVA